MNVLKTFAIFLAAWLFLSAPAIYVYTDIYLHPEKEDYYRLHIDCVGSRCIPDEFREQKNKAILSDGNLGKFDNFSIEYQARVKRLAEKLRNIEDLRQQEAEIYKELVEIRNPELLYSLKSLGISFMLGVASSLLATLITFWARRRLARQSTGPVENAASRRLPQSGDF